jgi:hypothetical protein
MNQIRKRFYQELLAPLPIVWPVFSALLGAMIGLGLLVSYLEGWRLLDGVYFAFVTGLTVGYGDLTPTLPASRIAAIAIGFAGILFSALLAAIGVRALQEAVSKSHADSDSHERELP